MATNRLGPMWENQQHRPRRDRLPGMGFPPQYDDMIREVREVRDLSEPMINDCEIIVIDKEACSYAELIEKRLKERGLRVDLLFPNENIDLRTILKDLASRGILYGIVVSHMHEKRQSMTVNILRGNWQEHKNMPLEEALLLILNDFVVIFPDRLRPALSVSKSNKKRKASPKEKPEDARGGNKLASSKKGSFVGQKQGMVGNSKADIDKGNKTSSPSRKTSSPSRKTSSPSRKTSSPSRDDKPPPEKKIPDVMKMIFKFLIEERDLSIAEHDKAIKFLMAQRDALAVQLEVPTAYIDQVPQSTPNKGQESRDSIPQDKDQSSRSRERSPRDRERAPPNKDRAPHTRDRSPPTRDRAPQIRDRSPPTTRDRSPISRDRAPLSRDRPPYTRDRSPPSRDRAPLARSNIARAKGHSPTRDGLSLDRSRDNILADQGPPFQEQPLRRTGFPTPMQGNMPDNETEKRLQLQKRIMGLLGEPPSHNSLQNPYNMSARDMRGGPQIGNMMRNAQGGNIPGGLLGMSPVGLALQNQQQFPLGGNQASFSGNTSPLFQASAQVWRRQPGIPSEYALADRRR